MLLYNDDYKNVIKDIKCDLILTDPPYLYEKGGNSKLFECDALAREKRTMKNSEFGKEEIYDFLTLSKDCMDNPQWYIFCSEKQLPYYLSWCVENKFLFNVIVWKKPLSILNRKRLSTNLEYIVRIYNWGCTFNKSDVNSYYDKCRELPQIKGKSKLHPQQKPIELLIPYIEFGSNENGVVLDPFMGSGSTGEACLKLNRQFIGIEKDSDNYTNAKNRLEV